MGRRTKANCEAIEKRESFTYSSKRISLPFLLLLLLVALLLTFRLILSETPRVRCCECENFIGKLLFGKWRMALDDDEEEEENMLLLRIVKSILRN